MVHLVVGASGFLGSHVTRELVDRGEDVRVLVRPTSDLRNIEDLDVDVRHGDIFDLDSVRAAMQGVDVVYYCVVDARPWISGEQLHRTNVEGLRGVLDVAVEHDLTRFIYTSTVGTLPIASHPGEVINEDSGPHNWLDIGGDYIRARVEGEQLVLYYARDRGLPAVAMCVGSTYGAGDLLPTPHGQFVKMAARGKLLWYVVGAGAEVVCVRDAARALVLAASAGRVGERYIVSERYLTSRAVHDVAAETTGHSPSWLPIPSQVMVAGGMLGELYARRTGKAVRLTRASARLMSVMTPLDHSKAVRELGWSPRPTTEAIREAALFFTRPRGVPKSR